MISVNQIDSAMAAGREELDACAKLGGKVELSSTEHLPVEIEATASAREKRLNPAVMDEIHLDAYRTAAYGVCIDSLTVRLRVPNHCQWDNFGDIA